MPYSHFGKQADVCKHLTLCEVMINEKPQIYLETNSASSGYTLSNTPEQQYGIYTFIDKAPYYKELHESEYFNLESIAMKNHKYIGSPGLAMSILGNRADKFIFFDIETDPLLDIAKFAKQNHLINKTEIINQDSLIGAMELLLGLPKSTLIYIDPYYIDIAGSNGYNYLDLFVKASHLGLKCFLWYGFNTLDNKQQINDFIKTKLIKLQSDTLFCVELIMEIIQKETIPCSPGILGNGLLTSNLSKKSLSTILFYSELLIDMYKETNYNGFSGGLYRDCIQLKNSTFH